MPSKTTSGGANPLRANEAARKRSQARADMSNRILSANIVTAPFLAPLLDRERANRNKRGFNECQCGRRISATRSQCRKCAGE